MRDVSAPIGVFDSGMGGLTVLRALRSLLPNESFVYLGDTARLPYGTKSTATVQRYAQQAGHILVNRGVKTLVVACNTASAAALPRLQQAYAPVPVVGVVEPGAEAVSEAAELGVLVLATEATVQGGAYSNAILKRNARARIYARAAPVLVTLAEEGRADDALTRMALMESIAPLHGHQLASVLLGCTHFPLFRETLADLLPSNVRLVDSALTTAHAVATLLGQQGLQAAPDNARAGTIALLATDGARRFRRVGAQFLGEPIAAVELVNL